MLVALVSDMFLNVREHYFRSDHQVIVFNLKSKSGDWGLTQPSRRSKLGCSAKAVDERRKETGKKQSDRDMSARKDGKG